jgi:DNA segregation ATPase FtsK/SpoIIIE-like protein
MDKAFDKARELLKNQKAVSATMMARRLHIGYGRASFFLHVLQQEGKVDREWNEEALGYKVLSSPQPRTNTRGERNKGYKVNSKNGDDDGHA